MGETVSIEQVRVEIVQVLRHKVLHSDEPYEASVYAEDGLFAAQHFAAFLPKKIVGAISVYPEALTFENQEKTENAWRLRGLVVLPEHRRQNCGTKLLRACAEFVKIQNGAALWCKAPPSAVAFFHAAHFEFINDRFAAETTRTMLLRL